MQTKKCPEATGINKSSKATSAKCKKTEEQIKENERLYRTLFETTPDGFQIIEPILNNQGIVYDFRYLAANAAFENLTGIKVSEIIGRTVRQVFPNIEQYWIDIYTKVLKEKKTLNYEDYFDSVKRWFTLFYIPFSENKLGVLFRDITEHKKAEEALAKAERQYRELFTSMSEMFQVFDLVYDDKGSLVDYVYRIANPAVSKVTGLSVEQLVGKSVRDLAGGIVESYWLELLSKVDKTGEPARHENYGAALDRYYNIYAWKMADKQVAVIALDITKRKNAEEELRKVEWDLNRAQAVGKIGSWRLDTRQDILRWSDENYRIFGVPKGVPMTYEAFLEIVHPDDRIYVDAKWKAGLRGEPYDIEHRIVADGKVKWVRERAELEFDKDGTLLGGFGTTQDITDIIELRHQIEFYTKHLEELVDEKTRQLKDSERLAAIGATAGMVGHDIRNPLQSIVSDLYILNDLFTDLPDDTLKHEVRESLENIAGNINYINKIVADLQDYSKAIIPEIKSINLYELVTTCFNLIELPDEIKVSINIDTSLFLNSDETLLRRIISNLVLNSIQAMPKGGSLSIDTAKDESNVSIYVEDTGEGIAESIKPKLFSPMMTTKSKGQGLGLAVVKRLVEALKGTISFESEEGKGTKFIIKLPLENQ